MKILRFASLQVFLFVMLATSLHAQKGWRQGEMEIRVEIKNSAQYELLEQFNFNGDVYHNGIARLYVVEKELSILKENGFTFEILEENLDEREPFWVTKDDYHSYQEIIDLMDSLQAAFPDFCKKYMVGESVEGRELSYLKISDNVENDETEPEVCFNGGFHGNEVGGPENIIRFARDICVNYSTNPSISTLIDNSEIFLYPMVNPDGRYHDTRYNVNGIDLNRDWGYMWDGEGGSPGYYSQIENKVFRDFVFDNQFMIQVDYHSGIELVIYQWGYRVDLSPDNDHIDDLANFYANESGYTNIGVGPICGTLYSVNGGSLDAYYGVMGTATHCVELSNDKHPVGSQIAYYYNINYDAMLAMIESSSKGVHGMVEDAATSEPVPAIVFIDDLYPVYTDPQVGDFHKYLIPGTYSAKIVANGYETQIINNIVVDDNGVDIGTIQLTPSASNNFAYKMIACQIPGNNTADEATTFNIFGENDNAYYSIGKNGVVIFEMPETIYDKQGNDIKIYEGDATDEGYSLFASSTPDGPWALLGTVEGTQEFDLADGGVMQANYFKIVDDGDGTANVDDAGFDFDAAEQLPGEPGAYLIAKSYQITEVSGNGNGRIDPGETVNFTVTLKNLGDQVVNSINGVLSDNSDFVEISNPNGDFGNLNIDEESSFDYELVISDEAPIGSAFALTLNINANSGGYFNMFDFALSIGKVIEDFETGDFTAYPWTLSGDANWDIITGSDVYEGTYSAVSGDISDNEVSTLEIIVNPQAPDTVSFYHKVSSESGWDYLKFYIDDNLQSQWSGVEDWAYAEFMIPAGNHTLKWEYYKDGSQSNGSDCAWIDFIALPGAANSTTELNVNIVANEMQCNDIPFQLIASTSGGTGNYTYTWSPAEYLNDATAMNPIATITENTTFTVEVSDGSSIVNDQISIVVNEVPSTPTIIEVGNSLQSDATAGNQWYNEGGSINGATEQTYTPAVTGDYYCIVSNEFGCSSEPSNTIHKVIGIKEINNLNVSIKPNPSNGKFTVLVPAQIEIKSIEIYSLDGLNVYSCEYFKNNEFVIDLANIRKGVYLMKILTNQSIISKKIIVE